MLEFNANGLLIPPTVIKSDLSEFKKYFAVDSPENIRRVLYSRYINYKNDLKKVCDKQRLQQWIDGSFVTKKTNPFDIDVVTFIDFEIAETLENDFKKFIYPSSLINYGIDGYIVVVYPENHKLHFAYKTDCAYWINQFDKTKPNRRHKSIPKGFLEIIT